VSVLRSSIHGYQKNGITGNEAGTTLMARENRVTGLGPTPFIAQNGIQIGFGAAGGIEGNVIANHVYTPCTSPSSCAAASTGVLIFEAADGVTVTSNTLAHGQVGILAQANGMTIGGGGNRGNDVTQTLVFDGIAVVGDGNLVRGNNVTHSDRSGIYVEGNGNTIRNNRINEAPIGIWNFSGTNAIPPPPPGQRNSFFNVGVAIQDPLTPEVVSTLLREAAARLARMAGPSPVR
jgi:parallel beta-helix repeat protein